MYYPLLFTPIYKQMVWGGNRLRSRYARSTPFTNTGESWDISCRANEMSVIENGPSAGRALADLINENLSAVLGTRLGKIERFPLLIKIIDATDNLSIQVHPNDQYAAGAGEYGKNEMWYILEAPSDGNLIIGLCDEISKEDLSRALIQEENTAANAASGANKQLESCLRRLPVKRGDIVNIPAGLVHALTSGVMVAEVQQNSDITYRLYDYNRLGLDGKPRPLHIDDALNVINTKLPKRVVSGLTVEKGKSRLTYTIANPFFAIIKYEIKEPMRECSDPSAFSIFTCVEGQCQISIPETSSAPGVSVQIPESRSVFIPAAMGGYALSGQCTLIKSFVPDIDVDFIQPLRKHGYSEAEIAQSTSFTPA